MNLITICFEQSQQYLFTQGDSFGNQPQWLDRGDLCICLQEQGSAQQAHETADSRAPRSIPSRSWAAFQGKLPDTVGRPLPGWGSSGRWPENVLSSSRLLIARRCTGGALPPLRPLQREPTEVPKSENRPHRGYQRVKRHESVSRIAVVSHRAALRSHRCAYASQSKSSQSIGIVLLWQAASAPTSSAHSVMPPPPPEVLRENPGHPIALGCSSHTTLDLRVQKQTCRRSSSRYSEVALSCCV